LFIVLVVIYFIGLCWFYPRETKQPQLQNFGVARTRPNPEAGEEDKKALLEGTHRGTNSNKNM
jgi:hypothetical protein